MWSPCKDQLSWHHVRNEAFRRLGGIPATVRPDNEKTAMSRGAGAWGEINPSYRRYAVAVRFHIDACPPRSPWMKEEVERRIRDRRLDREVRLRDLDRSSINPSQVALLSAAAKRSETNSLVPSSRTPSAIRTGAETTRRAIRIFGAGYRRLT